MKDLIIAWFMVPENLILLGVGLIQLYKLIRPRLPDSWNSGVEKASDFLAWAVPSAYNLIEALGEKGLISKTSKFSKFMDVLFDAAKKQGVVLSVADIAKAKLLVEGISQANKGPLPVMVPPAGTQGGARSQALPFGVSPSKQEAQK